MCIYMYLLHMLIFISIDVNEYIRMHAAHMKICMYIHTCICICINTYIYVHKPSAHAWIRKPHMITPHALHSISAPRRTISGALAAAGYACSSAATTSGPARRSAAQCSGSFLDWKRRQRATSARHTGRQVGRHAPALTVVACV